MSDILTKTEREAMDKYLDVSIDALHLFKSQLESYSPVNRETIPMDIIKKLAEVKAAISYLQGLQRDGNKGEA